MEWLNELENRESHLDACKLEAARIYNPLELDAAGKAQLDELVKEIKNSKK